MKVDAREFLTALGKVDPKIREELIQKAGGQENEEAFMKLLESRLSKSGVFAAGLREVGGGGFPGA